MKAGSVGSNPNDVTKPAPPLRCFLREVGESVANLNTAVVGLDAVENGHTKPAGLNISWNPSNRLLAARKARRFVLEAVLVRVSEALSQYVNTMAKLNYFTGCCKNWEQKKNSPSIAEKLADIAQETVGSNCYKTVGACLLIHWRNRVVHGQSQAKLTQQQVDTLHKSRKDIEDSYAGLCIQRLLQDFEAGKPTLKDISSLISMTIRLVQSVDGCVRDYSIDDVDMLIRQYGLSERIKKVEIETTPKKRAASIKRLLNATVPGLGEFYEAHFDC